MTTLDYRVEVTRMNGTTDNLEAYQGEVLLIVNTASKCGLTPQFKGLQKLHETYADQGLRVLGFPCNQFARQDPDSNEEIASFCQVNYGVDFTMHQKIAVNGRKTHPLYKQLKAAKRGALGIRTVGWNFAKFLVGRDGTILKRFSPQVLPEAMTEAIEAALAT